MGRGKLKGFLKSNWIILLILLLLLLFFYLSYSSGGFIRSLGEGDENSLKDFIDSFGVFSYVIFIFLVILEVVLAPIPAFALYVAGGALFGTFLGGILTLIGNLLGALLAFYIARKLGRSFVEKRIDAKSRKKFDAFAEKYGIFSLFLLRINPFTSSDIFSYLSGLTNMKVKHFLLGTVLGLTPMIFVQAYFGEAFVQNHPILYAVLIWISVAYLVAFVYLIIRSLIKNKNSEKNKATKPDN